MGLDILTQLKAKVDLGENNLITDKVTIPLKLNQNFTYGKILIRPYSKTIIRAQVDIRIGDKIIKCIDLRRNATISHGIYRAKE